MDDFNSTVEAGGLAAIQCPIDLRLLNEPIVPLECWSRHKMRCFSKNNYVYYVTEQIKLNESPESVKCPYCGEVLSRPHEIVVHVSMNWFLRSVIYPCVSVRSVVFTEELKAFYKYAERGSIHVYDFFRVANQQRNRQQHDAFQSNPFQRDSFVLDQNSSKTTSIIPDRSNPPISLGETLVCYRESIQVIHQIRMKRIDQLKEMEKSTFGTRKNRPTHYFIKQRQIRDIEEMRRTSWLKSEESICSSEPEVCCLDAKKRKREEEKEEGEGEEEEEARADSASILPLLLKEEKSNPENNVDDLYPQLDIIFDASFFEEKTPSYFETQSSRVDSFRNTTETKIKMVSIKKEITDDECRDAPTDSRENAINLDIKPKKRTFVFKNILENHEIPNFGVVLENISPFGRIVHENYNSACFV